MNWIKENPFLSGLLGVVVVVGGGLAFLLFQSMSAFQQANDDYAAGVQKLQSLQNMVPFPNEANLDKAKALQAAYEKEVKNFHQQLVAMEIPLPADMTPQKFQDELRNAVDRAKKNATAAGVALPEDFYLGFNEYSSSLPSEEAAPALSRQLAVISDVVSKLIDTKITGITELKRLPLPDEKEAEAPSRSNQRNAAPATRGNQQPAGPAVVSRFPFDIGFTADQGKFRVAFNSLVNASEFIIVRSLNIQNTQPQSPSKTPDPSQQPQAPADPNAQPGAQPGGAPTPGDYVIVLGHEELNVTARLEMIDFAQPEAPKTQAAKPEAAKN